MTKAEERENRALVEYGCYVCRHKFGVYSPPAIHHVRRLATSKKRRRAPKIPLCARHHQTGGVGVAIHAGRQSWEAAYGSEVEMAEQVALFLSISK